MFVVMRWRTVVFPCSVQLFEVQRLFVALIEIAETLCARGHFSDDCAEVKSDVIIGRVHCHRARRCKKSYLALEAMQSRVGIEKILTELVVNLWLVIVTA